MPRAPLTSETSDPSPEEEKLALESTRHARQSLPATYIDTWTTLTWEGHVRVVMGEEFMNADCYRFAYVMTLENAEGFARQLLRVAKERREKDAQKSSSGEE